MNLNIEKLRNRRLSKINEQIAKRNNRQILKYKLTKEYALSELRKISEINSWHLNCFKASFGIDSKAESDAHRDKKYEQWVKYRKEGCDVLTELRLKNGMGRPDLVVVWNNGDIEIIEIVSSEKEESIKLKEKKYPYLLKVVMA